MKKIEMRTKKDRNEKEKRKKPVQFSLTLSAVAR